MSIAIEKFDASVGGAERYCWDLAQFLAGKGHEVSVICMKASGTPHPSVRIVRVPAPRFPQFLRHLSFAVLHALKARSLRDHLHFCVGNTFTMDIYQPHGGVHRAWFLKETALFDEPLRTIVRILRRLSPKDMVQRALEWWTFRVARPRVIAISKMVAQDMKDFFDYPDALISLMPNGISLERFRPENRLYRNEIRQRYGIGPDEFVFLFVAQNPKLKGYDVLVEACRGLAPSASFRVLAIGQHTRGMQKAAADLGDRVIFGGKTDDLPKIYPACDCLVHPTYYDACSLVVLEALASGIPVITTRANGAGMYLNETNGRVIEPGDAPGLALAMREAMSGRYGDVGAGPWLKDHHAVFADIEELMRHHGR